MTSANSSSAERKARRFPSFFLSQRRLMGMRLWPTALSALVFTLYHVAIPIMVISSLHDHWRDPAQRLPSLRGSIIHLFGQQGYAGVLVIPIAVVFAIQGFSYLMSRREVDFYESQPVARSRRFADIFINSFLIFLLTYVVSLLIGLLICAAAGGVTRALMGELLMQLVRCSVLYLAVFAVGLLAVMLTGNVVVSILASAVLLFYEPAFRLVLALYQEQWLGVELRDSDSLIRARFSPLYHFFVRSEYGIQGIVMNLLIAVCVTALAYFCYTRRPNEAAGIAVPFRPVRIVVKIAVAVLGALCVGMLSVLMATLTYSAVVVVLAALIIACIMEIIYAFDFRAALKHFLENAIAAAIALLIFLIFAFDLFGIREWTPSPDAVEDCAILDDGYFTSQYCDDGSPVAGRASNYGELYMSLTDVEGVIDLVKACYRASDRYSTYSMRVLYRLKNGNTVTRTFTLPDNIDPALADRVFGSEEYREGYFQIYHDNFVATHIADGRISYDNGLERFDIDPADYDAFREAYKKDLEQFNYSFVREHSILGELELSYYDEKKSFSLSYPVYDSFDETSSFLKGQGAAASVLDDLDAVSRVTVYSSDAEVSFGWDENGNVILFDPSDEISRGVTFTEKAEIREILEASVSEFTGPSFSWSDTRATNPDYQIILFGRDGKPGHGRSGGSQTPNERFLFRRGEVPEFVRKALKQLTDEEETESTVSSSLHRYWYSLRVLISDIAQLRRSVPYVSRILKRLPQPFQKVQLTRRRRLRLINPPDARAAVSISSAG